MTFLPFKASRYKADPIFNENNYLIYGNPAGRNTPEMFLVGNYRYILISPNDFRDNEDLCFKAATYLYHNRVKEERDEIYTYFIGDINACKEVGDYFENQICKYVSYVMLEEWYPKNLEQINDKVVNFFLAQQKYYGQWFSLSDYDANYLLFISKSLARNEFDLSKHFLLTELENNGYFMVKQSQIYPLSLVITDRAIDIFQKAKNKENSNTVFIAIKFKDNEERIKAIQDTIAECGYTPVIMTEYQTNDWIMPEIFHQIQLSKFVVVDFSLQCDGAYYEAGYAQAMRKQVIHIYDKREEKNNPLHFDVAQKSTVIYNDYYELKDKLRKRIEATVN